MKTRQILSIYERGVTGGILSEKDIYFGPDIPERNLVAHRFYNRAFRRGLNGITSEKEAESKYLQWLRFAGDGNTEVKAEWERLMGLESLYIYTPDPGAWEVKAFLSVLNGKEDSAIADRPTDILKVGDVIFDIEGEYPSPYYVVEKKGNAFFAAKTKERAGRKLILPALWGKKWGKPTPEAIAKLMEKVAAGEPNSPALKWMRDNLGDVMSSDDPTLYIPEYVVFNFYRSDDQPVMLNQEEYEKYCDRVKEEYDAYCNQIPEAVPEVGGGQA